MTKHVVGALSSILLLFGGVACTDATKPSNREVRRVFEVDLPSYMAVERLEIESTSAGEKTARIHFRGSLKAKETLFAVFEGDPTEVLPNLSDTERRLRDLDSTGIINPFARPINGRESPETPSEKSHRALVEEYRTLIHHFVTKTADAGESIAIDGQAIAALNFGKWNIAGWSTMFQIERLGKPRNQYPAGTTDIRGQDAKAALLRIKAGLDDLEDAAAAAEKAEGKAAR